MDQGYIQVYTGDGKGKTTAAFGLAVRALCAGKSVYVGQFVKSMKYHETRIEELFRRQGSLWGVFGLSSWGEDVLLTRILKQ